MLNSLLALICLMVFLVLYYLSRYKADPYSEFMTQYGFKITILGSMGFYLSKRISYKFGKEYDRKIKENLTELFGQRNAGTFFEVHRAQKFGLTVSLVLFLIIIMLLSKAEASSFISVIIVVALIYFWLDKEIEKKIKIKKRDILIDLPEFINTIALLINAGLPLTAAIQKVVNDSEPNRPLAKELRLLIVEISAGKTINQAYEDFAQRCRVPEITRFVSTILQNLSKGNGDMVYVLRILSQEAWEKRKEIAKKQGEEAASKLVFPMVMIFLAVAIIVLAPAMINMGMN